MSLSMNGLLPLHRGESYQPLLSGSLNPPSSLKFAGQSSSFIAAAQTGQYKNRLSHWGTRLKLSIRLHVEIHHCQFDLSSIEFGRALYFEVLQHAPQEKTSAIHMDASKDLMMRRLPHDVLKTFILSLFLATDLY